MRYLIPILILILTINLSCSNLDSELKKSLSEFSSDLKNINSTELRKITTDKGFESIMDWSDSLKNDGFLNNLSQNLKNGGNGVCNKKDLDSIIILSLGKSDNIVGATNGYLVIRKVNNEYKIDQFIGGK